MLYDYTKSLSLLIVLETMWISNQNGIPNELECFHYFGKMWSFVISTHLCESVAWRISAVECSNSIGGSGGGGNGSTMNSDATCIPIFDTIIIED